MNTIDATPSLASDFLNREISFFTNAFNTKPNSTKKVYEILECVKNGEWKNRIHEIRESVAHNNSDKTQLLKKKLNAVTFSGTFSNRSNKSLTTHSGILCLDIDNLTCDITALKKNLSNDPHVIAVNISPSGNGLKVLVAIEAANPVEHNACYFAAEAYFRGCSVKADSNCKDVSRLCYVSYDPDCYIAPYDKHIQCFTADSSVSSAPLSFASASCKLQAEVYRTIEEPLTTKELALILHERDRKLNEIKEDDPDLVRIYERSVLDIGQIQLHKRNEWLLEIVPFLFYSFTYDLALELAELHRAIHSSLYSGDKNEHEKSFKCLWEGLERDYPSKLTEEELYLYDTLSEPYRSAFRICRFNARKKPNLQFFMGNDHIADRLGPKNRYKGSRIINRLIQIGVIELVEKGKRYQKGRFSTASTYKWKVKTTALTEETENQINKINENEKLSA